MRPGPGGPNRCPTDRGSCLALQDPERFVRPDPEMAATLLDQKEAGKMLLLITNR
jgi:hypothetical protein